MCRLSLPREVFMLIYADCLVNGISLQEAPEYILKKEGIVMTEKDFIRRRRYLKNERSICMPPLKGMKDYNSPTLALIDKRMKNFSEECYTLTSRKYLSIFDKLKNWAQIMIKTLMFWGSNKQVGVN